MIITIFCCSNPIFSWWYPLNSSKNPSFLSYITKNIPIWRFPKSSGYPSIIHFRLGFSMKSTNQLLGVPPFWDIPILWSGDLGFEDLRHGRIPFLAMAGGLWLGLISGDQWWMVISGLMVLLDLIWWMEIIWWICEREHHKSRLCSP